MSDQTLVDHASPTLAGLKTGALFPVHYPDEQSMREEMDAQLGSGMQRARHHACI